MTNVGYATLSVIPSARGFGAALGKQTAAPAAAGGAAAGKKFGKSMSMAALPGAKLLGGAVAAIGIGNLVQDSVSLRKDFAQTMNTMSAVAQVPAADMETLSDLAMDLGASTSFSANEAAQAMLELAKGGLSAATIQAGALEGTLTLAAAGGTDLATAATIASNAMNTFGLEGDQMASVAAALAGGANASSASIESLGFALSQVGVGAATAGLSIQETVGILAAFDSAGIKGSDAGTSLKTMLTRLVPQTKAAATAMSDLGLKFTDAEGNFLPMTEVAGELQRALGGLNDEARTTALNQIFGSDAARAATVLMDIGADGVRNFTEATSDLNAAQRVADARMSGMAGALEELSGAWETAKLALGTLIEPAVIAGANALGGALDLITPAIQNIKTLLTGGLFSSLMGGEGGGALQGFIDGLLPGFEKLKTAAADLAARFGEFFRGTILPLFNDLRDQAAPAIAALGETITTVVNNAGPILQGFANFLGAVWNVAGPVVIAAIKGLWNSVLGIIEGALSVIRGIVLVFKGIFTGDWSALFDGVKAIVSGALQALWNVFMLVIGGRIVAVVRGAFAALRGLFGSGMSAIGSAVGNFVGRVVGFFVNLAGRVVSTVAGFVPRVVGFFTSMLARAVSAVVSGAGRVVSEIISMGARMVSALASLPGRFAEMGWQIVAGLARGITERAGRAVAAIKNAITDKLPGFVKDALGIASPSKVFMGLGRNVSEGMALGIEQAAPKVTKAVGALTAIPDASDVTVGGAAAAGGARGGGPVVGALTINSTGGPGGVRADLQEAMFQLRRMNRGGVYA